MKKSSTNHFSPRAGKRESRRPVWKAGPISFKGICRGNKSRRSTRSTRARKKSSQSETRRNPNSSLANECRVMDQPINCSLLAIASCDQRRLSRHFRTCGPTRFSPVFINRQQGSGFPSRRLFPRWAQLDKKMLAIRQASPLDIRVLGKEQLGLMEGMKRGGNVFLRDQSLRFARRHLLQAGASPDHSAMKSLQSRILAVPRKPHRRRRPSCRLRPERLCQSIFNSSISILGTMIQLNVCEAQNLNTKDTIPVGR